MSAAKYTSRNEFAKMLEKRALELVSLTSRVNAVSPEAGVELVNAYAALMRAVAKLRAVKP